MFRIYGWKMAAVPGYSYKHPFALDQMFPQANSLSEKKLQQQTSITSTIFPISTFPRNYNDVEIIINHTKRNHAAHNDTLRTAISITPMRHGLAKLFHCG